MVAVVIIFGLAVMIASAALVTAVLRRVDSKRLRGRPDLEREPAFLPTIGDEEQLKAEQELLEAQIRNAERTCWKPVTEPRDGGCAISKFGGLPYLHLAEAWPRCGNCNQPLQLFVQLDSSTAPMTLPFTGLLQFFYCTNAQAECEMKCDAWAPRARSTYLRVVHPEGEGQVVQRLPASASFASRTIKSWSKSHDYPHYEDCLQSGIVIPDYLINDIVEAYAPQEGDKLLGWPSWVQGAEYPSCPVCDSRMLVLFQVASEDNVPYMFGDMGTGHISICPNHPAELAFGWACS